MTAQRTKRSSPERGVAMHGLCRIPVIAWVRVFETGRLRYLLYPAPFLASGLISKLIRSDTGTGWASAGVTRGFGVGRRPTTTASP